MLVGSCGGSDSRSAGAIGAGGCIKAVNAASDYAHQRASLLSYTSALRDAESDARTASDMESKYEPVLQAIVRLEADPEGTGDGGSALSYLVAQCGSAARTD